MRTDWVTDTPSTAYLKALGAFPLCRCLPPPAVQVLEQYSDDAIREMILSPDIKVRFKGKILRINKLANDPVTKENKSGKKWSEIICRGCRRIASICCVTKVWHSSPLIAPLMIWSNCRIDQEGKIIDTRSIAVDTRSIAGMLVKWLGENMTRRVAMQKE